MANLHGHIAIEVLDGGVVVETRVIDEQHYERVKARENERMRDVRKAKHAVGEDVCAIAEQACGWHPDRMVRYGR